MSIKVQGTTVIDDSRNIINIGDATVSSLTVNNLSPDGTDYGAALYVPVADGSGTWDWGPISSTGVGTLDAIVVFDEGALIGTSGTVTALDFKGNNIIATGQAGSNIATITVSDTPTFDSLVVSGIATFQNDVKLGDNDTLNFGDGNDLRIYHNGTDSYIADVGTGNLILDTNGSGVVIKKFGTGENLARFLTDGAVEFYYDNSKKFETTGYGATVFGELQVSGITTASQFSTGSGTLGFTTNTISGPSEIIIDPSPVGVGTTSGIVRIRGDLYVDGTQFIVNSTTIELADFNVGIATTVGTNALLDGAGIGIGSTNIRKTITWNNTASALTSSEDWNLVTGKQYEINGTSVLSSTTLGSGVVNSSLTSVGTLGQLNVSGITTSSRLTLNGANSTTTGGGQIYLNGATGNRIDFNQNGVAAPAFTTRSAGTKLVLYPNVSGSNVDYALGIESSTLWYSISEAISGRQHRWYAGTTQLADLKGSGEFLLGTTSLTGTSSQRLQVTGGAYVSGSVGIGVTNPQDELHLGGISNVGIRLEDTAPGGGSYGNISYNDNGSGINALSLNADAGNTGANSEIRFAIDGNDVSKYAVGGELLVGAATTTGTASQKLQVTGGAYVSGSVGIGTTNPSTNLDVNGTVNVSGAISFASTITSGQNGKIVFPDITSIPDNPTNEKYSYITFGDNGSISQVSGRGALMIASSDDSLILANGDVGRTFTSSNIDVDAEDIFILSDGPVRVKSDLQSGWGSENTYTFSGGVISSPRFTSTQATGTAPISVASSTLVTNLNADYLDGIDGGSFLRSDADDTASGLITLTNGLNVTNGNVGIGTTNPTSKLSVVGDGNFTGVLTAANLLPPTDSTGVVGNASFTWSNGRFTDLTVDSTLTVTSTINVRAAIDLADDDILRFGTGDDWEFFHDGTHNYMDLNVGNLIIRDNITTRFTFERTSGNLLLGSATSTGTASQPLQVTGGAYVSGNLGVGTTNPTSKLSVVGDGNFTGVVTATTFFGALTGTATTASSVTANSVGLGTDTFGDYVRDITGTANQITVTGGTGEGSAPTLSFPNQVTFPQDVTVARDLQVDRNLNVTGNITIGGTSGTLFTETLKISDSDIVLGFRTDAFGNDVSNDTTANHGGIAVASTEGNPLVTLTVAGIETLPPTYKKIMWFKAGTFSGLGTDAWLFNYAVGIGSTQVPNGVRLAAGGMQVTDNTISSPQLNISGVSTLGITTFTGNVSFGTSAYFGDDDRLYFGNTPSLDIYHSSGQSYIRDIGAGNLRLETNGAAVVIATTEGETMGSFSRNGTVQLYYDNSKEFETTGYGATVFGVLQSQGLQVSGVSTFSGITTHTAPLFGTQASFTGVVTASSFSGNASSATYADNAGIATFATNAGVSTSVIGGIGSITQLSVSGITTTGILNVGTGGTIITTTTGGLVGINTTNPTSRLDVRGTISIGRTDASTVNSIRSVTDINSWEYAGVFDSVSAQDTVPQDIYFKDDGTKMFILGDTGNDVNEYALSTAWEVNTATFTTNFSVAAQDTAPLGLYFKPDGTRMYICGNTAISPAGADQVRSYTLSNPWDISTGVTYDSKAYTTSDIAPQGVYFKDDGLKMYVVGSTGDAVYEYSLSIAWELDSTITLLNTLLIGATNTLNLPLTLTAPTGIDFNASGTKMYITDTNRDVVARFDLATPWDTTTTTFFDNLYIGFQELAPNGVFYQEDQAKAYIVGSSADTVFQYNTEVPSLELASAGISTRSSVIINNEARLNNRLYVTGDTHISSNTNLKGTLTVDSNTTIAGTLTASGAVTASTTTGSINFGTSQTTGTLILGGTSQTGAITLGRATTSQTTDIQAGVTASGNQKTINLGTGGASGSRTLITVGSATAGAISTVTIPSPTNLLIGAATTTGTASQPLQVTGGAYVSGNLGIGVTNPTSKLDIQGDATVSGVVTTNGFNATTGNDYKINGTSVLNATTLGSGIVNSSLTSVGTLGQLNVSGITTSARIILNAANNTANGGGQIYLSGATANRIDFNTAGLAVPTTTTRSIGTKIVLYPSLSPLDTDYAFGINNGTLWYSVGFSGAVHRWYAGTTQLADLKGTGELVIGTTSLTGTASQRLQVSGGAYVSGNLGVGNTNGEGIKLFVSQGAPAVNRPVALITDDGTIPTMTSGATLRISNDGSINSFSLLEAESSAGRLVFTNAGNLGIGTTNPTSKLSVVGDGNFTGVVTATSFSGSGTNLTGIVTSIVAGTNISVSGSTGEVTINSTASGGGAALDILEVMLFA